MSKLVGRGIVKTYGKKTVLQDVNLMLEEHKIYGMIGRNGAGKTTLLSILTAQNPATKGEILWNGIPVWENKEALSHICFSRELNQVSGNNMNALRIKDYLQAAEAFLPHWDKQMADSLVKQFQLDPKKRINKLSKGMLSMVTIIVALASKADFTILDEPVAGLDVIAREKFYHLLLEEYENTDRTFVVSTHIIEEAADIFEEVIIVKEGKILLKENTQDLLDRSYHVSGHVDQVDAACAGLAVHHAEQIGRSKGGPVLREEGQTIRTDGDVSIQKPGLQKLFVALCGEETV